MNEIEYIMDGPREGERLEGKTSASVTLHHLRLVGLSRGMRAVDAGAGTGAVAREMSGIVGASGEVIAVDGSLERLKFGVQLASSALLGNVRFVQGNLYRIPLRSSQYDFVWCRFVFEYLSDPDKVLAEMIRIARPGGKIVVGDLDGNVVFHYPIEPEVERRLNLLMSGLGSKFDPYAGRKLFHRFQRAGVVGIKVHCLPYHLIAGALPAEERFNWEMKFETIRDLGEVALGGRREYDEFVRDFFRMLDDPASLTYSVVFLVEGNKPD